AVASHELRTPLTVIKGYAKVALNEASLNGDAGYPATTRERLIRSLRVVVDKADHLTELVNEMLDISRIQHDMLPLERELFDLSHLVEEVVGNLQLSAPDFKFVLDLPAAPATVDADRQRIEQVVMNLVDNAVKYTGKATVPPPSRTEGPGTREAHLRTEHQS